jgi:hypothetical protein
MAQRCDRHCRPAQRAVFADDPEFDFADVLVILGRLDMGALALVVSRVNQPL